MFKTKVDGKALFRIFQREGLSQNAAARKVGMSTATMNKAMKGGIISQDTGKRICETFGLDPEEVLQIVEE